MKEWEEEYRQLRMELKKSSIDLFKLSSYLKITSASTRKNQLLSIQNKEELKDFERHRQSKRISQEIKKCREGISSQGQIRAFKQTMQAVFNQLLQRKQILEEELHLLDVYLQEESAPSRLRSQLQIEADLIQEEPQISQDVQQKPSFVSQQKVFPSALQADTIDSINQQLFRLGKFLGWKPADHLQFMRLANKHKQVLEKRFADEVSAQLVLPLGQVYKHIEKYQMKNQLEKKKKDILAEHNHRKSLEKKADLEIKQRELSLNRKRDQERKSVERMRSQQKKRQIEQYKRIKGGTEAGKKGKPPRPG